jgi:hypothetical protein
MESGFLRQLGVANEHMIGKIECHMFYKGDRLIKACNIKQVTGSIFESADNIEFSKPVAYTGPLDWDSLSKACNAHYKRAVGSGGHDIRIAPGASAEMRNNVLGGGTTTVIMECDDIAGALAWYKWRRLVRRRPVR